MTHGALQLEIFGTHKYGVVTTVLCSVLIKHPSFSESQKSEETQTEADFRKQLRGVTATGVHFFDHEPG